MTDIYNTVKAFLLADPGVAALAGTRIYIDTMLPTDYKISDGDCVVIRPNGGTTVHWAANADSMMILSYSTTAQAAIDLNEAIFTAMRRSDNPGEHLTFGALVGQRGALIRQPGDMFTMLATYDVRSVI